MSPLVLMMAGLATAALAAYVAYRRGHARRMKNASPMLRSIPEALERARRTRRRVLVAWVAPGDEASETLLATLAGNDGLEPVLRRDFELVRIDAAPEDKPVMDHLAAKYGVAKLVVPTLLALDAEGKRVGALEGAAVRSGSPVESRAKIQTFAESTRPGG